MTVPIECSAPEHELLPDYVDRALDKAAKKRFASHLSGCAACQTELREIVAFEAAMRASHLTRDEVLEAAWTGLSSVDGHLATCPTCRFEVDAIRKARPAPIGAWARVWRAPVPLALAALLVIGLGIGTGTVFLRSRGAGLAPPNGAAPTGTLSPSIPRGIGAPVSGLQPSGVLPLDLATLTFSWNGPPRGPYVVSFVTLEGRLIHRVNVEGRRLVLPEADRKRLAQEPAFFWQVEAMGSGGSASARVAWR